MKSFFSNITYIPKVDDSKVSEYIDQIPAIYVNAHTLLWRPGILDKLKNSCQYLIIDPSTNRLQYEAAQCDSFKKLPYYIKTEELNFIYSDPEFRLKRLVEPCLKFQIENKADFMLIPYLYSEEIHSQTFNANLSLLSDSIVHKKSKNYQLPLFGVINISSNAVRDPKQVHLIKDMYCKEEIDGYVVIINDLKDKSCDYDVLRGVGLLVSLLSEEKCTLVAYVGDFGDILCAAGASGVISGIGESESLAIDTFNPDYKGPLGRGSNWSYIPEVFNYLNDDDVKKIGYSCSCGACMGSNPPNTGLKNQHYLYRKLDRLGKLDKAIIDGSSEQFIVDSLDLARRTSAQYFSNFGVGVRLAFIERWIGVTKEVKSWKDTEEDEQMLSNILDGIDSQNK